MIIIINDYMGVISQQIKPYNKEMETINWSVIQIKAALSKMKKTKMHSCKTIILSNLFNMIIWEEKEASLFKYIKLENNYSRGISLKLI